MDGHLRRVDALGPPGALPQRGRGAANVHVPARGADAVLDPFVGTGSTCATAVAAGRNSIGVEVDPGYVKTAAAKGGTERRRGLGHRRQASRGRAPMPARFGSADSNRSVVTAVMLRTPRESPGRRRVTSELIEAARPGGCSARACLRDGGSNAEFLEEDSVSHLCVIEDFIPTDDFDIEVDVAHPLKPT